MRHLYKVSLKGHQTGMTAKNLAIVWAPNLLRSKDLNHKNHNNNNNLKDIALQAVCTEFLIKHCDLLFASHLPTVSIDQSFELGIIEGKHIKYIHSGQKCLPWVKNSWKSLKFLTHPCYLRNFDWFLWG